ncbi:hypothetical protein [Microbacterium candidum]|uniref:Uncharacterized protein n=1 Tax=Microbacterium candidum TaxID=3041922 RepID=A0ABT7MW08_9MICO|nr:hypothetical protein [Microbacterium sp. ASV49]MDL9978635.1 hypothetical protein [Microbacterium sp. ASV49]
MADWRRIRTEYDRSAVDWQKLHAYARKIANEVGRRDPHASSWKLMSRYWRRADKMPSYTETFRNSIDYLLLRDGTLVVEVVSWSEMLNPSYWETPKESSRHPFDDETVQMFDFEPRYYLSRDGNVETNRDHGPKLLVHAKGVGLSKRLKELLGS